MRRTGTRRFSAARSGRFIPAPARAADTFNVARRARSRLLVDILGQPRIEGIAEELRNATGIHGIHDRCSKFGDFAGGFTFYHSLKRPTT